MDSNRTEYDDLTKIKGIRAARQQWLQETFNVRTYGDLATLSLDAIESQLKAEGRPVAHSDIVRWLAQAQELAAITGQPVVREETPRVAFVEGAFEPPRKIEAWRPFASFTVEFRERTTADQSRAYQTAVHHMETDTDAIWPGIESKELCAWMLEQVGDREEQKATEDSQVESKPAPPSPIPMTITQVRIFQPPNADTPTAIGEPGRPLQGIIKNVQPFALEATFQFAARDIDAISLESTYQAQFFAQSLTIGPNLLLGSTKPTGIVVDKAMYTARLSQTSLQTGIYRLQVLVSLQSKPPNVGYLEIPLLQVA